MRHAVQDLPGKGASEELRVASALRIVTRTFIAWPRSVWQRIRSKAFELRPRTAAAIDALIFSTSLTPALTSLTRRASSLLVLARTSWRLASTARASSRAVSGPPSVGNDCRV